MQQLKDQFKEESVVRSTGRALYGLLLGITYVFLVLFALIALLGLSQIINLRLYLGNFILLIFGGLGTLFTNRQVRRLRTEYDYTFTNGNFEIARIMSGSVRKSIAQFRINDVLEGCYESNPRARELRIMQGVKKVNCTLNNNTEKLLLYLIRSGRPTILILEPSEEMAALLHESNPNVDLTKG